MWKTDVEKVPGELRGKPMLEKVTGEMCGKLMLGNCVKTVEKVTEKMLFQGHNVTSLKLKR